MKKDDILRMAREAGFECLLSEEHFLGIGAVYVGDDDISDALQRFYHLAFAAGEQAERERTKGLIEDMQHELRQRRMAARNT